MDNSRIIRICDCTLRQGEKSPELSFREKIELCRLLDKLDIDLIELKEICQKKIDSLLIRSISQTVRNAKIAVPVTLEEDGVEKTETVSNNMYDILTEMQAALQANDTDRLGALRDHLDDQFENLLVGIANLGTRSQFLDAKSEKLDDEATELSIIRANTEGINDTEEITKMQEYNYSWLLTLKFGSQILPQSLLDYIR